MHFKAFAESYMNSNLRDVLMKDSHGDELLSQSRQSLWSMRSSV